MLNPFHIRLVWRLSSLRFCALTSVGALFILGGIMKKKVTNEEMGQIIGAMAEKIRDDMGYAFRVAQSQMWIAENDLVDALDEKQQALYCDYRDKREHFYKIAKELYQRKF